MRLPKSQAGALENRNCHRKERYYNTRPCSASGLNLEQGTRVRRNGTTQEAGAKECVTRQVEMYEVHL